MRDLLRASLPYETTLGDRTIQQLVERPGAVPYIRDADTYHALADVAAHAGVLLVNASGQYEAELLHVINTEEDGKFRETGAGEVAELVCPVPHDDSDGGDGTQVVLDAAREALADESVTVVIADFQPADRPVMWWPTGVAPDPTPGRPSGPSSAVLALNSANSVVKGLLAAPPGQDTRSAISSLYVIGLLLGRQQPTPAQVALLKASVLDMVSSVSTTRSA